MKQTSKIGDRSGLRSLCKFASANLRALAKRIESSTQHFFIRVKAEPTAVQYLFTRKS